MSNEDRKLSPLAESFNDSTRIMKRVFVVLAIIILGFSAFTIVSSKDQTTQTDLEHPFYMSSGDTFTLETDEGVLDFSLKDMEEVEPVREDKRRVLLTYNYQVTEGCVNVSKLATAASYIDDSTDAFGVDVVPSGAENDIVYIGEKNEMKKPATGTLLIDIPKDTECIYTDMGSSLSSSGNVSFVVYDVQKQLGKMKE